jgi:hypothetical protein
VRITLLVTLALLPRIAPAPGGTARFVIVRGDQYGYIAASGRVAVPPQFDIAWDFSEGLARVYRNVAYEFIDFDGKTRIRDKRFQWVGDFSSGMARVEIDGQIGFVSSDGRLVIPPRFEYAEPFHDGLAVYYEGTRQGYVDETGRIVAAARYDKADDLKDGMGHVVADGWHGFVGPDGRVAVAPRFHDALPFSEGLAAVQVHGGYAWVYNFYGPHGPALPFDPKHRPKGALGYRPYGGKWGYIDKSGRWVIPPQFDSAWMFHEGLAIVRRGRQVDCIDRTGHTVFATGLSVDGPFSEGLAPVCDRASARRGCIDRSGRLAVPTEFDGSMTFHEGVARAVVHDRCGFINPRGKWVIPPRFKVAHDFHHGLALVEEDGREGYIDRAGTYVWRAGREPSEE